MRSPWTNESATEGKFWSFLEPVDTRANQLWAPLRRRRGITRIMVSASAIGEHGIVWIAWAAFQAIRRARAGDVETARRGLIRFLVAITFESLLVNGALKAVTRRPRPNAGQDRPAGVRMPISSSMPSGHATSAVMSAVLLSEGATPAEQVALGAAAATVAISRHHVQIHHFTDVLAGSVLGLVAGAIVRRLYPLHMRSEVAQSRDARQGGTPD